MIISVDAEKAFNEVPLLFMIKTLSKLGIEGKCLNLIMRFYRAPIVCIIFNAENLEVSL